MLRCLPAVDISGSQLLVTGEPFTPTRQAVTKEAGVTALPRYSSSDVGFMGYGCEHGEVSDDVHLAADLLEMIQPRGSAGAPAALYVTSLSPHAPNVLINVNVGDSAVLETRVRMPSRRARLDDARAHDTQRRQAHRGWSNLLDVDIVRILEESLPRRSAAQRSTISSSDQGSGWSSKHSAARGARGGTNGHG